MKSARKVSCMPKPETVIIGPGVVGQAVGRLLKRKSYPIRAVAGRSLASAARAVEFIGAGTPTRSVRAAAKGARLILIATQDRAVSQVCETLAESGAIQREAVVLHFSGALGSDALEAAHRRNAYVGALHPLQSFASPEAAVRRLKGSWFTFEGDDAALPAAAQVVEALGGRMTRIAPENRALYHAATCVLSNYLVALADIAVNMLVLSGLPEKDALKAAEPLLQGTVENLRSLGLPDALTGPIARGDVQTVQRHLDALRALPDEIQRLYRQLGLYTIRVARRKGTLDTRNAKKLAALLGRGM